MNLPIRLRRVCINHIQYCKATGGKLTIDEFFLNIMRAVFQLDESIFTFNVQKVDEELISVEFVCLESFPSMIVKTFNPFAIVSSS